MLKLKENLFIEIFSPNPANKYSKSLLNLKTIVELEEKEKFKIPENVLLKIEELKKKEHDFINKIPLNIIEHYFTQKSSNFNSYINCMFKENEINMKVNEVYILLEDFYKEIFFVASLLATYYNLEIKITGESNNDYA